MTTHDRMVFAFTLRIFDKGIARIIGSFIEAEADRHGALPEWRKPIFIYLRGRQFNFAKVLCMGCPRLSAIAVIGAYDVPKIIRVYGDSVINTSPCKVIDFFLDKMISLFVKPLLPTIKLPAYRYFFQ